jgi:hypothetical protein
MTAFTVSSSANIDTLYTPTAKAGNDTYAVNVGTLTIDSDTRYSRNATTATGPFGIITLASTGNLTVDGTQVRLIPYSSIAVAGTVPATPTGATAYPTVTQGSGSNQVSACFLGVWANLASPPVAAGSAFPSSGFIKVKYETGGATPGTSTTVTGGFTSTNGTLSISGTTFTCTPSAADVQGWIEVVSVNVTHVGVIGTLISVGGAWFQPIGTNGTPITSTGVAGQTIQLPASVTNTFYSGVQINTGVGGAFEWYPNAYLGGTAQAGPEAARGKVVWISPSGLLTLGGGVTGAAYGGYLVPAGSIIRVPNVVLGTTDSTVGYAVNETTLTGAGAGVSTSGNLSYSIVQSNWANGLGGCYSISLANTGFSNVLSLSGHFTAPVLNMVQVTQLFALSGGYNFAANTELFGFNATGLTVFGALSTTNLVSFSAITGLALTNCAFVNYLATGLAASNALAMANIFGATLTNTTLIGGSISCSGQNVSIYNTTFISLIVGTTPSYYQSGSVGIALTGSNLSVIGLNIPLANTQPCYSLFSLGTTNNVTIAGIGSPTSPLSVGTVNPTKYLFYDSGGNLNFLFQDVYLNGLTSLFYANTTADMNFGLVNVWDTGATATFDLSCLLAIAKGCYTSSGVTVPPAAGQRGSHFYDYFTSSTTGLAGVCFTYPVTGVTSQYVTTSFSPGSIFSGGSLSMSTLGDYAAWTWPFYLLGYTGFATAAATATGTYSGTLLQYQWDKNDGLGFGSDQAGTWTAGSYATAAVYVTGTPSSSSGVINFAGTGLNTTANIKVGDYVFGTGISAGNTVKTINSSTQITCTNNNSGTASTSLTFSHTPQENNHLPAGMATNGIKLMLKATCLINGTTQTLHTYTLPLVTTSAAQQTQYPTAFVTVTLNNVVPGSLWTIVEANAPSTVLASGVAASSTVVASIPLTGSLSSLTTYSQNVIVRIRCSQGTTNDPLNGTTGVATKYQEFETQSTLTTTGATSLALGVLSYAGPSIYVSQVLDTIASTAF